MPKKKTPVRKPWTKEDLRQLKAHSKTRTPVVEVGKAMKRTEAAAKGEDDRRWSWSSPLRTLALQATCNKGGVFPGPPSSSSSTSRATTMKWPLTAMAIALGSLGFTKTPAISIPPPYGYKYQPRNRE